MHNRHSEPCLTLHLTVRPSNTIEAQTQGGVIFRHTPGPLPEKLRADKLWQKLLDSWPERRALLTSAGAELGEWLYGREVATHLRELIDGWSESEPVRRIELRIPREFCDFPWELCTLEGIGPPSIHPGLTVVRRSDKGSAPAAEPPTQIAVEVLGVKLDEPGLWDVLEVGAEIERVRQEIEGAGTRSRFMVRVDALGSWQDFLHRCETFGPPHVFHFAGHGLDNGRGLVFRSSDGGPEEIEAELVAVRLARSARGRQTRLAFLNACTTAAAGKRRHQPFGGLSMLLLQHGIPMVVGMHVPLLDTEAQDMAAVFYRALASGSSVDCAMQVTRDRLYMSGQGVGWAFMSLSVSGPPVPLWRSPAYRAADQPSARVVGFGHREQRSRLENFLLRRQPMVVVIHGEVGSGHRHVASRVRHDLEKAGNVLWRPVAEMRWFVPGEKLLSHSQLAAGIARALSIADTGTTEQLMGRLAQAIADRCGGGRVLVIDLIQVLSLNSQEHAEALVTLVHEVFVQLMDLATGYTSSLPVFLLLSVSYPKSLPSGDPRATRVAEQVRRTEAALTQLGEKKRLKAGVRVELLPRLQQITEEYVADFLEEVLELSPDDAESMAQDIVGLDDNEAIFAKITQLLADWEGR